MKPYPWLYRLAMDSLIEVWRRHHRDGRDPRREIAWPDRSSAQQVLKLIDSATTPSEAFAREELRQRVQHVLSELKPRIGRCSGCATTTSSRSLIYRHC